MIDLDKGKYGETYKVSLLLHVSKKYLNIFFKKIGIIEFRFASSQNQSRTVRTARVVMSSSSVFYTGRRAHLVKRGEGEFSLRPGERETLSMEVEPKDYMPRTVENCMFVNRFVVRVEGTGQVWHGEDDFLLEKPKLVRAF